MIYVAIYLGMVVAGAISMHRIPFRRFLFMFFTLLLFCFVAFRYEVGCDRSGYESHCDQTYYWNTADALKQREPAYWFLLVQIHQFGLDYPCLNLFYGAAVFLGLGVMAKREPAPLAFLSPIINIPMSAIRLPVAIGFICLAFVAFHDRKLIYYVVTVVVGSLFHMSAIVFLALAPVRQISLDAGDDLYGRCSGIAGTLLHVVRRFGVLRRSLCRYQR